jgi:regulator of replication initiation timing
MADESLTALISQLQAEVLALRQQVASLQAENAALRSENAALREENDRLRKQLALVERQSARQAAPFRRRETKKVPPAQKKRPGRQPGHPGSCRVVPQQIDETAEVPLEACPQCGGPVRDKRRVEQIIEEIPQVRPRVTRVITYEALCPCCGDVYSTHPLQTSRARGAAKVQLGPRALATAAQLNKGLGLPMRKTCGVLKQLAGLRLTGGGLSQALFRIAQKTAVAGEYRGMTTQLRAAPAVYADETSWWVGGPGAWLWVYTTPAQTYYRVEDGRGHGVVHKVLGKDYAGTLVSDCLATYDVPTCRKHKCIGHHLRAIEKARELSKTRDPTYLDSCKQLFQDVIELHKQHSQLPPEEFAQRRGVLQARCDDLLAQSVKQPGDVKIQNRLFKQRAHLLTCLYYPEVEPTNNRAERQLRPAVIARKVSCGNKTPEGAECWQILASLAATCAQQARSFIEYLAPRLPLATTAAG